MTWWHRKPKVPPFVPTPADWTERLKAFKTRLATLPHDDPFWDTLLLFLDLETAIELDVLCGPLADINEVNRLRGRVGMLRDHRRELTKLMDEARAKV